MGVCHGNAEKQGLMVALLNHKGLKVTRFHKYLAYLSVIFLWEIKKMTNFAHYK